jgi:hypothetical protein
LKVADEVRGSPVTVEKAAEFVEGLIMRIDAAVDPTDAKSGLPLKPIESGM